MRLRLLSIPLGALVLATAPVYADRLTLSIEQDVTHQSNLFKTPDDEESDAYYRVRPGVEFQGESEISCGQFCAPRFGIEFGPLRQRADEMGQVIVCPGQVGLGPLPRAYLRNRPARVLRI